MQPRNDDRRTTRRQFVAGALGALASGALLLAACGGSSPEAASEPETTGEAAGTTAPATSAAQGPWTFTDDRGETASLPSQPVRIVAQEDAAAALWPLGVGPVGVFGNAPLSENPQFEGEDLSGIEPVGETYGELNLEKIAALQPDLIVTPSWEPYGASGMGFKDDAQLNAVSKIAPIVAIEATVPYATMVNRYYELAAALGVDVDAPEVAAVRDEFQTALDGLKAAAAAKPGLQVLATSANADNLYVADPSGYSDLQEYESAGLELVVPTSNLDYGWEELSWENADKYPADVILYDGRAGTLSEKQLDSHPTWGRLPAVGAGQIGPWYVGTTYSLPFFTQRLQDLTALVEQSKDIVA